MATVKRYEELVAWQKSRELTREIYRALKTCNDFGFRDQIQRASVSVMSNIAEGFERGTRQEFINYLFIAKGSCGEVRSQLYIALDNQYLNVETFNRLNRLSEDCSVLIWRLIQSIKRSNVGGLQFKHEKSRAQLERERFDRALEAYDREVKKNLNLDFEKFFNDFER